MPEALLSCGEPVAARRWADDTVSMVPGWHQMVALMARAHIALAQNEPEQAERDAHDALRIAAQTGGYWRLTNRTHPGAAASLREGLDETLTVLRLGVPPTLARTLRSTNCIESMISVCREHAGNVKRWRDGQMALRWCAAGMVEAGKQFRRVNGHLHLPSLRAALEREIAELVGPDVHNDEVSAA
jgi:putative transposase